MQGQNVRKLIAYKMSREAIPSGGSVADGIAFLTDPEAIKAGARVATEWANAAIQAVRMAAEPNTFKSASDETIAGVILKAIEDRKAAKRAEVT